MDGSICTSSSCSICLSAKSLPILNDQKTNQSRDFILPLPLLKEQSTESKQVLDDIDKRLLPSRVLGFILRTRWLFLLQERDPR